MGGGREGNHAEASHDVDGINGGFPPPTDENTVNVDSSKTDDLQATFLTIMLSLCAGTSFAASSWFLTMASSQQPPYDRLAFVGHMTLPLIVLPPFMTSAAVDERALLVSVGLKREFFIASVFFCLPYMSPTEITVTYHGWLVVFIILVRWFYLKDFRTFPLLRTAVLLAALAGIYRLSSFLNLANDIRMPQRTVEIPTNTSFLGNAFPAVDRIPDDVNSYLICILFAFVCSVYRTTGQKYSVFLIYFHELFITIYFGLIAKYIFEPPFFSKWRLQPVMETTCLFTAIVVTETIGLWSYFKCLHLKPAVKYTWLIQVELVAIYFIEKHFVPKQQNAADMLTGTVLVLIASVLSAGERILILRRRQNQRDAGAVDDSTAENEI